MLVAIVLLLIFGGIVFSVELCGLITMASYVVTQCLCYAHSFVQLKTRFSIFSLGLICLYHRDFSFSSVIVDSFAGYVITGWQS